MGATIIMVTPETSMVVPTWAEEKFCTRPRNRGIRKVPPKIVAPLAKLMQMPMVKLRSAKTRSCMIGCQ